MIALSDQFKRNEEKPIVWMDLRKNLGGAFNVQGVNYRPEWPRGSGEENLSRKLVQIGIETIRSYLEQNNTHPEGARVKLYQSERITTEVIVQ